MAGILQFGGYGELQIAMGVFNYLELSCEVWLIRPKVCSSVSRIKVWIIMGEPGSSAQKGKGPAKSQKRATERMEVPFDVEKGSYKIFIAETLCKAIINYPNHATLNIPVGQGETIERPLLPERSAFQPERWIDIKLSAYDHTKPKKPNGSPERNQATLTVRGDDVWFSGFKNKDGECYEFGKKIVPPRKLKKGKHSQVQEKKKATTQAENAKLNDATRFFPGSTFLGFSGSYRELIGGSSYFLGESLGKISAREAVSALSEYKGGGTHIFKLCLAKLTVIICESARMLSCKELVGDNWCKYPEVKLTWENNNNHIEYWTNWRTMSKVMRGLGIYTPDLSKIGINNNKDACNVVYLILNTSRINDGEDNGNKSVETSSQPKEGNYNGQSSRQGGGNVQSSRQGGGNGQSSGQGGGKGHSSYQGDGNGQSSLQGGSNGQSSNQQKLQQNVDNSQFLLEVFTLQTTNSNTPFLGSITVFDGRLGQIIFWNEEGDADNNGNFVLIGPYRGISADGRVALKIIPYNEEEEGEEVMIWDPYTMDEHQCDKVLTKDIPGDLKMTYAVVRSAVEASVQVDIFLFKNIAVDGQIIVQCKLASGDKATVVLMDDHVDLAASSAGSRIPLTRSVVAWPISLPMDINVNCFHPVTSEGISSSASVTTSLNFSFEYPTRRVCFKTVNGIGHIRVCVDDTREYRDEPDNSLPRSLMKQVTQEKPAVTIGSLQIHPRHLIFTSGPNNIMSCLLHLTNTTHGHYIAFRCPPDEKIMKFCGIVPPDSTSTYLVKRECPLKPNMDPFSFTLQSCVVPEAVDKIFDIPTKKEDDEEEDEDKDEGEEEDEEEEDVDKIFEIPTITGHVKQETGIWLPAEIPPVTAGYRVSRPLPISPSASEGSYYSIDMPLEEPSPMNARVWVHLFLFGNTPGTTKIYGEIGAHFHLASGEKVSVVLFSTEDTVEFIPSSAGSTIPLTQSNVPWPVSLLVIKVSLGAPKATSTADEDIECLEFPFADGKDKVQFSTLKGIGFIRVSVDDTGGNREEPNKSLPRSLMKQMNPNMSVETELLVVHPSKLSFTFQQNKLMHCLLHFTNKSYDQHVAFRFIPDQKSESYYHRIWETSGILPPDSTSTFILQLKILQQLPSNMDVLSLILQSCITLDEDEEDVDKIFDTETNDGIVEVILKATVCDTAYTAYTAYETLAPSEPIQPEIKAIPDAGSGSPLSEVAQLKEPRMAKELAATVQIDLFLFKYIDFNFYGKITAHSQLPSGENITELFSCEFKDKVSARSESAGWNVPLIRSVVKWYVGSPLLIKVGCFHYLSLWRHPWRFGVKGDYVFSSKSNTSTIQEGISARTTTTPPFEGLEFSFNDNTNKVQFSTIRNFGYICVSVDDTGKYREKPTNSLPRSLMKQIEIDTFKETKLLVIRHNELMPGLLHLTNKSDEQHVAFRCNSVIVQKLVHERPPTYHEDTEWELSGILPPDSTSTYLLQELNADSLKLESCVASQDQKELDAIFLNQPESEIEEVILSYHTRARISEPIRCWGAFSIPGKGIKEVALKATFSHPTMTFETQIKAPTTEPSIDQGDLLDIYPLQLCFPFKLYKVMCCPLRLTNKTDDYIIFMFLPYTPYSELHLSKREGILPPRSICTYFVATKIQMRVPQSMDAFSVILKSCAAEKITGPDKFISSQDPMQGAIPKAISDREPIPPKIQILTREAYSIRSMDVHPTEPLILVGLSNGKVAIWNYQTWAREKEFSITSFTYPGIISAIFIAPEKWFVVGDGDGSIHVVQYKENKVVKKFQAHKNSVESLAVHPNQKFVLSASKDILIKLWNWDVNPNAEWECLQTYDGHFDYVKHAMFNPYDNGNTFASASEDHKVKIWSTNDRNKSPKAIAILDCVKDKQQSVAYLSLGGQPHIFTGSSMGTARVWDLRTNMCIKELEGPQSKKICGSVIGVVDCALENINPVLVTVSVDCSISFLDAITYKSRYETVNFDMGNVYGFQYAEVEGKRSIVIALDEGIVIMEMNEDSVNPPSTVEVEPTEKGVWSRLKSIAM